MIISARRFNRANEWTLKGKYLYKGTNQFLDRIKPKTLTNKSNRYKVEVSQTSIFQPDAILFFVHGGYNSIKYMTAKDDVIHICRTEMEKHFKTEFPKTFYVKFVRESK